jgi:hypothetical protein
MGMILSHQEDSTMQKKCVPYGSDVSAGEFQCADCGRNIKMGSRTSLPPCPNINTGLKHTKKCWIVLSGQGDSPQDPYPKR